MNVRRCEPQWSKGIKHRLAIKARFALHHRLLWVLSGRTLSGKISESISDASRGCVACVSDSEGGHSSTTIMTTLCLLASNTNTSSSDSTHAQHWHCTMHTHISRVFIDLYDLCEVRMGNNCQCMDNVFLSFALVRFCFSFIMSRIVFLFLFMCSVSRYVLRLLSIFAYRF